jgi:hypothetical protein
MAEEVVVANTKCGCAYCKLRGLVGPLMIISLGVIFLIAQYSRYSFFDLWPILLIILGVLLVAQALVPKQGHIPS